MIDNPYQAPRSDSDAQKQNGESKSLRWTVILAALCWFGTIGMLWTTLSWSFDLFKSLLGMKQLYPGYYGDAATIIIGSSMVGTVAFFSGCRWYQNRSKLAIGLTLLGLALFGCLMWILSVRLRSV